MQKINYCNMCIKPNSKQTSSHLCKHKFPSFDQGDFGEDLTGQKYILEIIGNDWRIRYVQSFFSLFF